MKIVLAALDEEIEHAYNTYKSPQMQSRVMNYDQGDPGDPVTRALKKISNLKKKRMQLAAKIEAIDQYVDNIDDYFLQGIIRYHYFEGNTWETTYLKFRGHTSLSVVTDKVDKYFASKESIHD